MTSTKNHESNDVTPHSQQQTAQCTPNDVMEGGGDTGKTLI